MADVIPVSGLAGGDGDGGRDRAQLLLVGALSLAVVLLSLSLLLNSVIYTENLATRQKTTDAQAASDFRFSVVDGLGGALTHANRGDAADFDARVDAYRNVTGALVPRLANESATDGLATDVERRSIQNGTRIVDATDGDGWVRRDGAGDWTVATDARVRAFSLRVNVSTIDSGDDVRLVFDDGTPRDVIVENAGGDPRVRVESPGTDPTCSLSAGRIDVAAAQVDGRHCEALSGVAPEGRVDVSVVNGDQVDGTYSLVVDRAEEGLRTGVDAANYPAQCSPPSTPTFERNDSAAPYTTPAVYAATADLTVQSRDIDYRRTVRAAPGEAGDPATGPTFTTYEVTRSGDDFTVDWNTSDPNGDIDHVEIRIYNMTADSTERLRGTEPANGTATFADLPTGSAYYVNGTVADATSTRRVSEIHHPNGAGGCPP